MMDVGGAMASVRLALLAGAGSGRVLLLRSDVVQVDCGRVLDFSPALPPPTSYPSRTTVLISDSPRPVPQVHAQEAR